MGKLSNNQINDALDAELGKEDIKVRIARMKERSEESDRVSGEEFAVDKYGYNFRVINDAIDLKEGTSYSEHMLDLNELMEKGVLQRGNKLDLSDMPEIETIQAATQEQLDMLTSESKKQITAIHLSNNTPVGWNDNYDFDNKYEMDSKLDLSSYHNVTEVQTHFYVNNDLQDIVMPEKATELLCRHSKMKNLQKDGGLQDIKVVLDRAETSFDFDDGYVDPDEENRVLYNLADKYIEEKNEADFRAYLEEGGKLDDLLERAIYKGDVVAVDKVLANGANADATVYNYDIRTDESLLSLACMTPFRRGVSYNHDEDGNLHLVESEEVMTYKEIAKHLIRAGATDYSSLYEFHDNSLIEETFKIKAPTAEDIYNFRKAENDELLETAKLYTSLSEKEIRLAEEKAEFELKYEHLQEEQLYHNEQQTDGTYTLYFADVQNHKDVPILKSLLYPIKVEKASDNEKGLQYESLSDNITYIKVDGKHCVRTEDMQLYAVEDRERIYNSAYSSNDVNHVTLVNLADKNKKITSLEIESGGKFNRNYGIIEFRNGCNALYSKNGEKYFVDSVRKYELGGILLNGFGSEVSGISVGSYIAYLDEAKKSNFILSTIDKNKKEELVKKGASIEIREFCHKHYFDGPFRQTKDFDTPYKAMISGYSQPYIADKFLKNVAKEYFQEKVDEWFNNSPEERLKSLVERDDIAPYSFASQSMDKWEKSYFQAIKSIVEEGVNLKENKELTEGLLLYTASCISYRNRGTNEQYMRYEIMKDLVECGARWDENFREKLQNISYYSLEEVETKMRLAKIKDAQKHHDELAGVKVGDKTTATPKQTPQTTLSVQDIKNAKSDLVK